MAKEYFINNLKATWEEYAVYQYLLDLSEHKFIKKIAFQPKSFELFPGIERKFYKDKQLKTKTKRVYTKRQYLINPHVYTPDFEIMWNLTTGYNRLVEPTTNKELDNNVFFKATGITSYLEVKPSFDQNNMTRMFTSHVQPCIWEKHNTYIQLIKPLELFRETFIPSGIYNEFFYQKSGKWGKKGDKKYKWEYKNINQFLDYGLSSK